MRLPTFAMRPIRVVALLSMLSIAIGAAAQTPAAPPAKEPPAKQGLRKSPPRRHGRAISTA
jgi:hypothetical protein